MTDFGVCVEEVCFSRYRFTGKERDSESGNDYFGARYYSSAMGRWMSPDPSGLLFAHLRNPQELNLYAYAQNRPTVAIDPNGLMTLLVVVENRNAQVSLFSDAFRFVSAYSGIAQGIRGPSRRVNSGDTPFGKYLFTGMVGHKKLGLGYGTGKISFEPDSGEFVDYGRSLNRIHGGGSKLGQHAYDDDQDLVPTLGCVRLHNEDVNSLIDDIQSLEDDEGEKNVGDSVYIGVRDTLMSMAEARDKNGKLANPDLWMLRPLLDPLHWFIPPGGCVPGAPQPKGRQGGATMKVLRHACLVALLMSCIALDAAAERFIERTLGGLTVGVSSLDDAKRLFGNSLHLEQGVYVVRYGHSCELYFLLKDVPMGQTPHVISAITLQRIESTERLSDACGQLKTGSGLNLSDSSDRVRVLYGTAKQDFLRGTKRVLGYENSDNCLTKGRKRIALNSLGIEFSSVDGRLLSISVDISSVFCSEMGTAP